MAVFSPTSLIPLSSPNARPSRSSYFPASSPSFSAAFPPRLRSPAMVGSSSSRVVAHFSPPSQLEPLPDGANPRPHTASMTPFGVIMDESSMPKPSYKWHRVLLKVSGEALAGDRMQNIDPKITMSIAREVAAVTRLGIEGSKWIQKPKGNCLGKYQSFHSCAHTISASMFMNADVMCTLDMWIHATLLH